MLTVVLKATRGNPQVKVPAPSLETGSYPKDSRRHGQPAPIVAGPAYPAPPDQPSRPQNRATERQRPAPDNDPQSCTEFSGLRDRRGDRA